MGDTYREIEFVESFLPSDVLGLWLGEHDGFLRLYDPVNGVWIGPSRERVDEAETRAAQESHARQQAETELAKLRAALKRLQTPD